MLNKKDQTKQENNNSTPRKRKTPRKSPQKTPRNRTKKQTKKTYSGYYSVSNTKKYISDIQKVYYRSGWEKQFCKWCDTNKRVIKWAIEPIKIPYFDEGTGKKREYNPDFYVKMDDGKTYLIEIKPDYQTHEPKKPSIPSSSSSVAPKRKRNYSKEKKYIREQTTYLTNTSKWKAAKKLCDKKGWVFLVVTENNLESIGIKLNNKPVPGIKPLKPKRKPKPIPRYKKRPKKK